MKKSCIQLIGREKMKLFSLQMVQNILDHENHMFLCLYPLGQHDYILQVT